MTIKKILYLLLVLQCTSVAIAQKSDFEIILEKGNSDYIYGRYENALSWFKQAYKMDKNSEVACYKIALAYSALSNHQQATLYSSKTISMKGKHIEDAYILNAAAWEELGRKEKAKRIYKSAIKKYPTNYLLRYNYAFSLFKNNEFDEAEKNTIVAIELNSTYMDSHALLAYIMYEKGERIKSMLPLYYFLLFEHEGEQNKTAYEMLRTLWEQGVRNNAVRDIKLLKSGYKYNDFADVELIISTQDSLKTQDNENRLLKGSIPAKLSANTQRLFKALNEKPQNEASDFWWLFYGKFFSQIEQYGMTEAFCYFISNNTYNPETMTWVSSNINKFNDFVDWMEAQ